MGKKCRKSNCPDCGDELIHQTDRRASESSSAYGQHIFDAYDHNFDWADIDGVISKIETGIMRVVEHKAVGHSLKDSQRRILPRFAAAIDVLADLEIVHPDSGVFVVNADHPYATAFVRRYYRTEAGIWVPGREVDALKLTGLDLANFETGMPVDRLGLVGRAA